SGAWWEAKTPRHSAGRLARVRKMLGTKPDLSATSLMRARRSSGKSSSGGTSNMPLSLCPADYAAYGQHLPRLPGAGRGSGGDGLHDVAGFPGFVGREVEVPQGPGRAGPLEGVHV